MTEQTNMLTASQIQQDVIELLEGSPLQQQITGSIYPGTPEGSLRPRDSKKEDIVVIFTQGTADQIEEGTVTVNLYVTDLMQSDGTVVQNTERIKTLEYYAALWVDSLIDKPTAYRFTLGQTIWAERETQINQHFIVVKLNYKYYNGNR
jgi:hypothetical protein